MAAPKVYRVGGKDWRFGILTFGQFEALAPIVPRFVETLAGQASGGATALSTFAALAPLSIDIFQVLAGPGEDVRALPIDLTKDLPVLIMAISDVFKASGVMRKAPEPGEAPPPAARKKPRRTARK